MKHPQPTPPQVHPLIAHFFRSLAFIGTVLVAVAAFAALTGCGGGDDTPPPDTPTPDVRCVLNPKACQ